jgi:hypothetical protein
VATGEQLRHLPASIQQLQFELTVVMDSLMSCGHPINMCLNSIHCASCPSQRYSPGLTHAFTVACCCSAGLQMETGEQLRHLPASLLELAFELTPEAEHKPLPLGHLTGTLRRCAAAAKDELL